MKTRIDIACLVDDDPVYIFATKKVMTMANFCNSFLVFNNGREALDSLIAIMQSGAKMPDVILLDVNMPVMDGWQFLDEFIKVKPLQKTIIYIVTSSIDPEDIQRAKSYSEVSDYIVKPVTEKTLHNILSDFQQA
ncbi:MAG: response regulator [Flavipsychrobacter sp.]|nr:response regulator [Flavipsychrobacter sp.]